ncbi:MAG: ribonuclease H-like domain-containing protein [Clostridiaceae bacterium]
MILKENDIFIGDINDEFALTSKGEKIYKNALYFDLEHYVYKQPKCIGVFGCCYYNEKDKTLKSTQYMIENKEDAKKIIELSKEYFCNYVGKKYIVTFSGNNDFTVINYLLKKYNYDYEILDNFIHVDIQKEYEKANKSSIGLKNLEKEFLIDRGSELISGSNLAKTFSKIIKDEGYFERMPEEKREKILLYNQQDVVSLFHLCVNWNRFITKSPKE